MKICQRCKKEYKQPNTININPSGVIGCSDLYCFPCFVKVVEEGIDKLNKKEKDK